MWTPDAADTVADAPGRVNLLGEHTDYHEGYVLPTVIPQRTRAAVRARDDGRVRASSSGADGGVEEYVLGEETRRHSWVDYVQGLTVALARRGLRIPGFDLRLDSDIPIGAGVSSSAALEVSVLRALRSRFALDLDDVTLARVGQAAETDFVGAPVGIMDQMASSLGRDGEALFLDTRTLAVERIPLPAAADLLVIDSAITHAHAGGDYAARRRESFQAAAKLGLTHLRDGGAETMARLGELDPLLARRARHVITENQRVLAAVAALHAGDHVTLGRLFNASHVSMRDDYEITTPDIDALVSIAQGDPDVFGARMTGGGFGGAIVVLARRGCAPVIGDRVLREYATRTNRHGAVLVPR